MRKIMALFIVALFVLSSVLIISPSPVASSDTFNPMSWWDISWQYKKSVVVTSPSTDVVLQINVTNSTGGDINCGGHLGKSDFGDIRFIANDATVLHYWRENYTVNKYAKFWVNISTYSTIQMYYGNPSASYIGVGNNTFTQFYDMQWDPTTRFTLASTASLHNHYRAIKQYPSYRLRYNMTIDPNTNSLNDFGCSLGLALINFTTASWGGVGSSAWADQRAYYSSTQLCFNDMEPSGSGTWHIMSEGVNYRINCLERNGTYSNTGMQLGSTGAVQWNNNISFSAPSQAYNKYFAFILSDGTPGGSFAFTWVHAAAPYYLRTYVTRSGDIIDCHFFWCWAAPWNPATKWGTWGVEQAISAPTVQTNPATGVQGTNATLQGTLTSDGGSDSCTVRFQYGTTTAYGTNTTNQTKTMGQNFSQNVGSLSKGAVYHYRTRATNVIGMANGTDSVFLTKPDTLTGFAATTFDGARIDLSWTNGVGGDGAYIEYAIGSAPAPWNVGSGTKITVDGYATGTSYHHTSLPTKTHYFYKAWEYADDSGIKSDNTSTKPFGDSPKTANAWTIVAPTVSTNASTNVEETTATLNGFLNNDGYSPTTYIPAKQEGGSNTDYITWDTGAHDEDAQLFNVSQDFYLTGISFYGDRSGSPSPCYYELRNTTPTLPVPSAYLTQLSFSGASWTLGWHWYNLSQPYKLNAGQRYAIVCRVQHTNSLVLTYNSSNGYPNGYRCRTTTGESGWTGYTGTDMKFRIYGYNASAQNAWCRFQYGLTISYGTTTANQTITTGQTFSQNIVSLIQGKLYHFRAVANNTNFTSYGADKTFLTKPNEPTSLSATVVNTTAISLTWTPGTGANNTRIQRKTTGYPTTFSDGTNIYNNTGNSYTNTGLTPGTIYYYRAWSYAKWGTLHQWSDNYSSDVKLTKPNTPTGLTITKNGTGFTLTWIKGTGANNTRLQGKVGSYPASITDGSTIYNGSLSTSNHFGLTGGDTWYYRAWSFATWDGLSQYSDLYSQANKQFLVTPTVTTNSTTGIKITNATLWGWLQSSGGENAWCRFQYGLTTGYGTTTANQIKTTGQTFSQNIASLIQGTFYHYRAVANNTNGTAYGTDKTFLTKPYEPTGLTATKYSTGFTITWTTGLGKNNTVIRGTVGGYPASPTSGTLIYNGSLSTVNHLGLTPGDTWYYRAWSFTVWDGLSQYSDLYSQTNKQFLTNPTVTTNDSTNVEETTASLNAYLNQDGGIHSSVDCQYGLTTGYGSDSADEILTSGNHYTLGAVVSLLRGRLYHFHARAININGTSYGTDKTFLTKPETITNFETSWSSSKKIDLSWTNGIGGDGAYIEYAVNMPPEPWEPGNGTTVNATGFIAGSSFAHTGLINGSHYFYKAWPYAEDTVKSDGSATKPFGTPQTADQWIATNATEINLSDAYPTDGATGISRYVVLGIYAQNWQGYPMDIIWSSNVTGSWNILGINASVYNGGQSMSSYGIVDSPHNVTIVYSFSDYIGGKYTYVPCYGNDLGEIKYVRIFTNYSFTPIFNGTVQGSEYTPVGGITDITNDAKAPTEWSWQDIKKLDLNTSNHPVSIFVTYDMHYGENLKIYWNVNASVWSKYKQETHSFTTEKVSPIISNPSIPDIATWLYLRPTLSVYVEDPQGQGMQVKFYRTNQAGNLSSGWTQMGSYNGTNGTFSCSTPSFSNYSQIYYWRVNATDGTHTTSKTYRFTTRAIQVPPIGLTATTINNTKIHVIWSVDNNTDYVLIKRMTGRYPYFSDPGFIYSGPATQFNDTFCSPGTLYYYRGWSYNASDGTWTTENTSSDAFTKPNGPNNLSAVAVSYNRINLTWNIGSGAEQTLIYRRKDHYPTVRGDGDLVYNGAGNSYSDTYRIGGNITYYYRGWSYANVTFKAWNNATTTYEWYSTSNYSDNDKTPVGPPTIIVTTPSSVTETGMRLNALVISNGGDNATCGFYWGLTSEQHNVTIGHYSTDQTYNYSLSNLTIGTSYFVNTWGRNIHGFTKGEEVVLCTLPAGPGIFIVNVNNASSITLTWTKGIGADETRIRYKTTGYPTSPTDGFSAYFNTGVTTTLYGLAGNTTYYYRAWSYNNSGGFHSSVNKSDDGTTFVGLPTVINYYPIYINDTEATLKGRLVYNNGDNCTCGFQYGLSPGVYTHNYTMPGKYTTGQNFQFIVTDLAIGTTWYYRSWATNLGGFSSSSEIMFVTKPVALSSYTLAHYGSRQFNMSWIKGQGADETRILRKTTGYPTNINDGDLRYNSTSSSFIDKDWYPPLDNTLYYYRAWSYNNTNHLYSNIYESRSDTTSPLLVITDELPNDDATNVNRYVNFSIKVSGGASPINVTFWNCKEFDIANRILGDHASGWSDAEYDRSMPPYNGTKGGVLDYESGYYVMHTYWYHGFLHWYSQSHTAENWFGGTGNATTSKITVTLNTPIEISGLQFSGGFNCWVTGSWGNGTGTDVKTVHFEYHDYNKNQWITASRVPIYGESDKLYTNDIVKVDQIRMWFNQEFVKDKPYYTAIRSMAGHAAMNWITFVPPMKIYNAVISPGDTVPFTSNFTLLNHTYYWGVTADNNIDRTYSHVYNFTTEIITMKDATPRNGEIINDTSPDHDCSVLVNHTGGDLMKISFYTKADNGSYILQTSYDDSVNGTYGFTYHDSNIYSKKYYWRVVANDSLNEYNETYFFQMRDTYAPSNARVKTYAVNKTIIELYNITRDNKSDSLLIRYKEDATIFKPFLLPMDGYPANQTDGIFLMNSTNTSINHTGLKEWTQYNYSAWGWNATDHMFGSRYTFFGRTEGGQTITDETPINGTMDVLIFPTLKAYISDFDGDTMNISIRTNASGSWVILHNWSSIPDGYRQTNGTMAHVQNTHYWWSVNATDGIYWMNKTFNFWTGSISPPQNFKAIAYSSSQINLTWHRANDSDYVQIVRRTDIYPTSRTDPMATLVYNGSGENATDLGLSPGSIAYYRGYGYNNSIASWGYHSSDRRELTYPQPPTNFQVTAFSHRQINITWTQGIGANKTIIVCKYDFYPINSTDGSVIYNSSGLLYHQTGLKPGDYLSYLQPLTTGINNMGVYPLGGEPFINSADNNLSSKWDPDAGKDNQTFSYHLHILGTEAERLYSTHLLISDFYHDPGATWNAGITKIEVYNGTWHTIWTGDAYSPDKQWFNYNVSTPLDICNNVTQIRYTAWTQFISPNVYEVKIGKLGVTYKYSAYSFTEMNGLTKVSLDAVNAFTKTKDTPFNTPPEFSNPHPNGTIENPHPNLSIHVSDRQGQTVAVTWESNNTGTWHTIGTASVHNNTITLPTTISYNTSFYWRVKGNDSADVSDSIFYKGTDTNTSPVYHFRTRKAYVEGGFSYMPLNPTNKDTMLFRDLSKNATHIIWKVGTKTIAEAHYATVNHPAFNLTKEFNLSNIYQMTLQVENGTDAGYYINTTHQINVARNLTLLHTPASGINYVGYHLTPTISSLNFATLFNIPTGWWIHRYNSITGDWDSYWVNELTNNFTIHTWDAVVIVGSNEMTVTIPITQAVNTVQLKAIPAGISYLVWTNSTPTTLMNLSIGLATGDWIHVYDTLTNEWNSRWVGYALVGNDVQIKPYDVIAVSVASPRTIRIG